MQDLAAGRKLPSDAELLVQIRLGQPVVLAQSLPQLTKSFKAELFGDFNDQGFRHTSLRGGAFKQGVLVGSPSVDQGEERVCFQGR